MKKNAINYRNLKIEKIKKLNLSYRNSIPFPHIIIDNFLEEKFARRILNSFKLNSDWINYTFVNNFKKYKNDFINHPLSLPYFKKSDEINIFKLNSKFHGLKFEEKLKKLTKLLKLKKKRDF